ncbi:FadR/GntR family transcriptional regulator [Listeria fleischmannii]|jgi:DNA-binding FadR family transcriptional regulator|uniref:FadR family transcriptional regulator n=2 Tax=Listeria fleischmannii TaxID=1069827 RepID=A0A841YEN9_9LIST|nr:FadR/GntR family transcriptional regulator [Listeria fleischmannii]EIA19903.1 GntR family transcriptional regulator [Listeria fleischmannii subsp. coloradonensis]EUJ58991.1 putative transcription regulator, GntR family protein [Listeria fleischmannii FSL S10-1203]MBC1398872.1 FadR family transcriptional regulator [Listeria fleischmannii]MBC1427125.1 FadR family transcriptional regulator [Listeria fleischmannii]STY34081.1 Pyruvate dehydrogenase complex repressor [Listeria fleischmannii subsp
MNQKIERTTLSKQVYKWLEEKIRCGEWQVGDKIPSEKQLMEDLEIGRNTLREAVQALSQVGLLEVRQGHGTFVVADSSLHVVLQERVSHSSLLEIFEVRHALEGEIVALACMRRTDEELGMLFALVKKCQEATDMDSFVEADMALHHQIALCSKNTLLADMYAHLFDKIQMSIMHSALLNEDRLTSHVTLIDAISKKDVKKAQQEVDLYISLYKNRISNKGF